MQSKTERKKYNSFGFLKSCTFVSRNSPEKTSGFFAIKYLLFTASIWKALSRVGRSVLKRLNGIGLNIKPTWSVEPSSILFNFPSRLIISKQNYCFRSNFHKYIKLYKIVNVNRVTAIFLIVHLGRCELGLFLSRSIEYSHTGRQRSRESTVTSKQTIKLKRNHFMFIPCVWLK